jgi:TM2 domain-containing membrane protein YozV
MQSSMPVHPPIFFKNPTVATLLSFVITGLGQFYNGQIFKGIAFLGSMFISCLLMALYIGFILAPIVWILGMVDANTSAKRINQRLAAGASPVEAAQ